MACLTAQVHNGCHQTHIHTVQEVAMTVLTFLIGIADTAEVYLAHTTLLQPGYGLLYLTLLEPPVMGKIVHHTIGNDTQRNLIARLLIYLHQAVDGIVQRRVAAGDDNCLISVVNHHLHQSLYAAGVLTLHEVVIHTAIAQRCLDTFPTLFRIIDNPTFRAIQDAPTI